MVFSLSKKTFLAILLIFLFMLCSCKSERSVIIPKDNFCCDFSATAFGDNYSGKLKFTEKSAEMIILKPAEIYGTCFKIDKKSAALSVKSGEVKVSFDNDNYPKNALIQLIYSAMTGNSLDFKNKEAMKKINGISCFISVDENSRITKLRVPQCNVIAEFTNYS